MFQSFTKGTGITLWSEVLCHLSQRQPFQQVQAATSAPLRGTGALYLYISRPVTGDSDSAILRTGEGADYTSGVCVGGSVDGSAGPFHF